MVDYGLHASQAQLTELFLLGPRGARDVISILVFGTVVCTVTSISEVLHTGGKRAI